MKRTSLGRGLCRRSRGGLVPDTVAVPPGAEQKLKSLKRRFSQYVESPSSSSPPSSSSSSGGKTTRASTTRIGGENDSPECLRLRAPGFERFVYESGMLTDDVDAAASNAVRRCEPNPFDP